MIRLLVIFAILIIGVFLYVLFIEPIVQYRARKWEKKGFYEKYPQLLDE